MDTGVTTWATGSTWWWVLLAVAVIGLIWWWSTAGARRVMRTPARGPNQPDNRPPQRDDDR